MKNRKSLIDEIHELEQKIFKEFALETSNNIHVEAVDLKNPLTSIIKILISDLISSQLYTDSEMPKIIPKQILIKDEQNKKYSHFHFNDEGIKYLKKQFDEVKKRKTDEEMSAIFEKFRSEILNINKEANIIGWHSVLYQNISENTFTNQYFTYCRLQDAAYTIDLTHPSNQIDFNNTDSKHYKDIRADEKINYSIFFDYEISENNAEFDNEKTKIFVTKIAALALHTKRNRQNFSEIENQATRAAISQVMARNMSHNIGSHVMNKLIGDLSKVEIEKFKNYNWGVELYKDEADSNKKLLDQISIFNNYVKCRMDYLADISFGTPLMQTNKYAYGELFTELDKVRLLLENISGLDNWKFEIKFTKNGIPLNSDNDDLLVAIPNDILGTQAFYNILENIIRNTAKHAQKKTVKNEEGKDITPKTVFTVNFIDSVEVHNKKVVNYCQCKKADCGKAHRKEIENALNEFIVVEVYDDIPVEGNPKELSEKELNEYKRMMGDKKPDFKGYIDYLVFSQNSKLNEDILSENSKLRSYSLGLVEMDASAAYLRKRPVEYINHRSYDIQYDESWSRNTEKNEKDKNGLRGTNCRHFLKAFKKTEGDKNYLGYRFFLHRPAVVLVVTELLKDDNEKKEKLKKEGIWIVTKEEFENDLIDGKVYPNEFVVYAIEEKDSIEHHLRNHKTSIPIRILAINQKQIKDAIMGSLESEKKPAILWEEFCWEAWIKETGIENGEIGNSVNCDNDLNDGKFRAALIDHKKEDWLQYQNCKNANFVEVLTSKALEKLPKLPPSELDSDLPDPIKKFITKLREYKLQYRKVLESSYSTIVVLDERIQKFAEKEFINGKPYFEYLKSMRIILPEIPYKPELTFEKVKEIDMGKFNLSGDNISEEYSLALQEYITYYSQNLKDNDFILIHYSILERIFSKETDKLLAINNYLNQLNLNCQIVITTGRGIVVGLTYKVRFINLSPVITSFIEINNKHLINYILNSTRKIQ
jgi:hypothetical protein